MLLRIRAVNTTVIDEKIYFLSPVNMIKQRLLQLYFITLDVTDAYLLIGTEYIGVLLHHV